jgi:hypothetical protein
MVNRPSVPEIITVNSEELQTQIRDLLPSQNGFGSELQASNVITPIIDLTSAAEGTGLRSDLQSAVAFGSQTNFFANNSTDVIENAPGFYRIFGVASVRAAGVARLSMSDGLSTKVIWQLTADAGGDYAVQFDFVSFLSTGDSISAVSTTGDSFISGSSRQLADAQGTLVNPSGYPL